MNSLVKVFSNFKEFYNEINGATLTGAIDVIVVEQPNGDFKCSPFHVRFGKLGVLRSREKVVDIEINGEPVDIHMKLGDSGEAFFVEEITEEDIESLPDNLATSPIPSSYFPVSMERDNCIEDKSKIASDDIQLPIVLPRRNSIDLSKETDKAEVGLKIENQVSDYSHRRHTDNTLNRSNLRQTVKEYTTQKIRQEWAEQHEEIFQFDAIDKEKDWANSTHSEEPQAKAAPAEVNNTTLVASEAVPSSLTVDKAAKASNAETAPSNNNLSPDNSPRVEESKSKKKRRKKTQMKKKNAQRKSSSSSSIGSNNVEVVVAESQAPPSGAFNDDVDNISLSNKSVSMSLEDGTKSAPLLSARNGDESPGAEANSTNWQGSPVTPVTRIPLDLDIHFFSDTEVTSPGIGPGNGVRSIAGRPSTPIQSDSELEISLREKDSDMELMKNTASWKWGELPTPKDLAAGETAHEQAQAQRNSMLSSMFNFMKKTNKIRKVNEEGVYLSDLVGEGMNEDLAAMYLPQEALLKEEEAKAKEKLDATVAGEDDRESGNGTSLPQSPSSMEGQKSTDSDYDDGGKPRDEKYLDFVAMSLSGMDEEGEVSPEEFDRYLIKYNDVCQNPSLFTSPNLVVRLNGKYYSWAAACPIVMSIITFQKPLSNDVIEQLMSNAKPMRTSSGNNGSTTEVDGTPNTSGGPPTSAVPGKRSWWYWRRSQNGTQDNSMPTMASANKGDDKDVDHLAVGTQTTRPNSPDVSDNTLSKTDSTLNAENTSAMVDNMEELSQASSKNSLANGTGNSDSHKSERYKKTLRLSSEAIKKLNLKMGMNEIEFSVTTAYQGTTRCKCFLFRWKHNDKVVISDIDGTITRSDVLGHILPMVGKDWAQLGVAELFSKIEMNGYKLLYLSARAIGQARATREYLRSIRQGDVSLPDGPLLLNPTSLISAFHREVIERKPEQFKIACLSDIKELFPVEEPFYAGYGNRINDVWAYRAVGIPIMRIFTINTKGELKHELTQTFQSSYSRMTSIADQLFPPIEAEALDTMYSNFNYWRNPIPMLELELDVSQEIANTTRNSTLNASLSKPLSTIPEN